MDTYSFIIQMTIQGIAIHFAWKDDSEVLTKEHLMDLKGLVLFCDDFEEASELNKKLKEKLRS